MSAVPIAHHVAMSRLVTESRTAEDVPVDQGEREGEAGERLRGCPQPVAEPEGRAAGDRSRSEQERGAARGVQPGPRDDRERDRGEREEHGAEPEQCVAHSFGAPVAGYGCRWLRTGPDGDRR